MATPMRQIACETQRCLARLHLLLPPSPPSLAPPPPQPLALCTLDIQAQLAQLGCSTPTIETLVCLFERTQRSFRQACVDTHQRALVGLSGTCEDEGQYNAYAEAVTAAWVERYEKGLHRAKEEILAEVAVARDRASALLAGSEGRGNFSAEVVAVLERAFAQQTTLNRAERRSLAEATGLEEKQVGTWFANQRQRRPRPSQRERNAPYDLSSRPKGRRDFSGSSASSMSSLNSALSDISTAPSSVESWISSSASSTISYDSETIPSSTREASPLPFGALPTFDDHTDAPPAPHHPIKHEPGYRVASACGPPPSWTSPIPTVSTTLPTPSPSRSSFPRSALPASSSSIHPFFASPTTTTATSTSNTFTFDSPAPPPSPTTAQLLSTAPFLQGFDFEQDPQDGAFWQQFLQGGFGAELGLGGGVSFGVDVGGEEGGEGQMSLMLPMPTPMEEECPCGMDWGGVGQQ